MKRREKSRGTLNKEQREMKLRVCPGLHVCSIACVISRWWGVRSCGPGLGLELSGSSARHTPGVDKCFVSTDVYEDIQEQRCYKPQDTPRSPLLFFLRDISGSYVPSGTWLQSLLATHLRNGRARLLQPVFGASLAVQFTNYGPWVSYFIVLVLISLSVKHRYNNSYLIGFVEIKWDNWR